MKNINAFSIALMITIASASATAQVGFQEPLNALSSQQREFRSLAIKGEYQSMRNIAYSYLSPSKGETGSKIGACAWYLLIPSVHKAKFHAGDTGNIYISCSKLEPGDLNAAYEYAFRTLATSK
jgi:hypothetical protein